MEIETSGLSVDKDAHGPEENTSRCTKKYRGRTSFFFFGDRTSLVVQWLRLYISTANCTASIPGWDLKSHMPCSMPENFKERKGIQKQR